jgi:hypothetical protein
LEKEIDMSLNARITLTPIGREYGWDRLAEVDLELLQTNRAAKMNVIERPGNFPNADIEAVKQQVRDIDAFMSQYGELLVEFA